VALSWVSELIPEALDAERLLGFNLEAPDPGAESGTYALEVRGWVLGKGVPVESVEIMHRGVCLWRVPPDIDRPELRESFPAAGDTGRAGFYVTLNALSVPTEFELVVRVALADKTRVRLARIRGGRSPLRSSFEPRLAPLLMTTLGRTGSTALMRMLDAHPDLVAFRPFEYEPRVATYWMGIFRALSEPASYLRQIAPTGPMDATWWLGRQTPLPRRIRDPELQNWLGVEAVDDLAGLCQSRIDALYQQVADRRDRAGAVYFAEKLRPDDVPAMMWELYPRVRELIVVRDFRDMVSSMFAFNEKRGIQGFRRDSAESDADYVLDMVRNSVGALARAWEERSDRAHVVRYEDVVLRPAETLAAILDYVELDASDDVIQAMVASLDSDTPEMEGHRTSESAEHSIGRWRQDLTADVKDACERALGPSLELFGYAPARR
jgi:hypothetical protein